MGTQSIKRVHQGEGLLGSIEENDPDGYVTNFDAEDWLSDTRNIALVIDQDIALFAEDFPGCYEGHYFFKSRGRQAVKNALSFLNSAFMDYGAEVIKGLTPHMNRPAMWMSYRLGFKSYGTVDHHRGECEIFCLTKSEFKDKYL